MNRRLLIVSPAKSGIPSIYVTLFANLLRQGIPGWDADFLVEANQNALPIARNMLANEAIRGDYDRMLMLDTDHRVDLSHLVRILSHDHEAFPIVSGLYCMKRPGTPFFLGIRAPKAEPAPSGLLEAHFLPTGFLSVSVEALRTIERAHPDHEFYAQDDRTPTVLTPAPKKTATFVQEFFPVGCVGPRTAEARLRRVRQAMEIVIAKGGHSGVNRAQLLAAVEGVQKALTDEQDPGYLMGEDYHFSLLAYQAGVKQYLDLFCLVPHIGAIDYPITDPEAVAKTANAIPTHEGNINLW